MTAVEAVPTRLRMLARTLGSEGLRLFFPLAAIHGAIWPFLWVVVYGLNLPGGGATPVGLWHAREMIFGCYGAAVIGFITSAVPEWTDTKPPQGMRLFAFAGLWGAARVFGLVGHEIAFLVSALGDVLWSAMLVAYVGRVSWHRRTTRLLGFMLWLVALTVANASFHVALIADKTASAYELIHMAGLVMLGLLGLALARITVPVTNLVLDPSEATSPFRPHPGRLNLAPGLVALAIAAEIAGVSAAVGAYLLVAAGAAFLDRAGEALIGREIVRAEILALAGSSVFAGTGLLLVGASRLGAPLPESAVWHLALMGGLGLAVLAVFAIAGLRHTGRPLGLSAPTRIALMCAAAATLLRVLPDLGLAPEVPGPPYAVPALLWGAAFVVWLATYWPYLSAPRSPQSGEC